MDERYNEQQSFPPVRRRRKKIPKWKRMLRKYWPPIRFGLIILAMVALVWWGASSLVNGIRTAIANRPTEPPVIETRGYPLPGRDQRFG